jgi:hypothetical protein
MLLFFIVNIAVLELNCNSTRLAVIDMNGVLTFYDLIQGEMTEEVLITVN